ncbi:hypothetical protein Gotur_023998 [Gossypium turneri]
MLPPRIPHALPQSKPMIKKSNKLKLSKRATKRLLATSRKKNLTRLKFEALILLRSDLTCQIVSQ